MRVAIIGTYPPTRCGIATFTADVEEALVDLGVEVVIVNVDPDPQQALAGSGEPAIDSTDPASYCRAARWLNDHDIDLVLVEHEFGIHGGVAGDHLLSLTSRLRVPYAVTLHTVLSQFTDEQSATVEALCSRAVAVTVFTHTAQRMLLEQELVPAHAISIVPHGAPVELYQPVGDSLRAELALPEGARVVSTFGLLSPGKGLETAITALRVVVDECPDVYYVIAGRTHPGEQRYAGEHYRDDLQALVSRLGLDEHVRFVDRFLEVDEIAELLSMTSAFLTPYRNPEQIVSGALTFAVAAGCPVVSTPYRYGRDLLADGSGILVPFDDPAAFAQATLALVTDGPERTRALAAAQAVSATLSWPAVGRTLQHVLSAALDRTRDRTAAEASTTSRRSFPTMPATDHLLVLLDDTSVMQHASYRLPRYEEGYCVDDAARLLPVAAELARDGQGDRWAAATPRLLAYLRAAALDGDGLMRNFMSWDRRWLDEPHDGDHVGRAIWGLGELVQLDECADEAELLLRQLLQRPLRGRWPRHIAYTALGVVAAADHLDLDDTLHELHDQVSTWTTRHMPDDWTWPEDPIVYDAARVPEVMIRLGARMGDDAMIARGVECLAWFEQRCRRDDHYRFPGHLGLRRDGLPARSGDEQPLEATAMIDAARACLDVTGNSWALDVAHRAWGWFLGNNRLATPLGSLRNGACRDALTAEGVNFNCGAESTISFHRSAHAMAALGVESALAVHGTTSTGQFASRSRSLVTERDSRRSSQPR